MSKSRLVYAGIVSLILCQAPTFAVAETQAAARASVNNCLAEASQPVTRMSPYQNGSPRLREALKNAYKPGVSAAKAACRALANTGTSKGA